MPLEHVIAHLHACHVSLLLGPVERTGARQLLVSVYFRDLDGNLLEVSHTLCLLWLISEVRMSLKLLGFTPWRIDTLTEHDKCGSAIFSSCAGPRTRSRPAFSASPLTAKLTALANSCKGSV